MREIFTQNGMTSTQPTRIQFHQHSKAAPKDTSVGYHIHTYNWECESASTHPLSVQNWVECTAHRDSRRSRWQSASRREWGHQWPPRRFRSRPTRLLLSASAPGLSQPPRRGANRHNRKRTITKLIVASLLMLSV